MNFVKTKLFLKMELPGRIKCLTNYRVYKLHKIIFLTFTGGDKRIHLCAFIQKLSTLKKPVSIRKRSYTLSYPHYPQVITTIAICVQAVKREYLFCK